ncbi:MAG: hypothetical protein QXD48_00795 [Candidatus Aenigmatarchaeota archaeon]
MEKEIIEKIKENPGKILLTTDVHGDKENLIKAMKIGKEKGAKIAFDLGDTELGQKIYDKIARDIGLEGGIILETFYDHILNGEKDIKEISKLFINNGTILPVHYVIYNDKFEKYVISEGSRELSEDIMERNYNKNDLEKIIERSRLEPFLIIKGDDHKAYIGKVKNVEKIFSVKYVPRSELTDKELKLFELKDETEINEPGLYVINPGFIFRDQEVLFSCMVLDCTRKGYFKIEYIPLI